MCEGSAGGPSARGAPPGWPTLGAAPAPAHAPAPAPAPALAPDMGGLGAETLGTETFLVSVLVSIRLS